MNNAKAVTNRFLQAFDKIIADRSKGKITQGTLAEKLGMNAANLPRLRTSPDHNVTIDTLIKIIDLYNISALWLLTGKGSTIGNNPYGSITEEKVEALALTILDLDKVVKQLKKKK